MDTPLPKLNAQSLKIVSLAFKSICNNRDIILKDAVRSWEALGKHEATEFVEEWHAMRKSSEIALQKGNKHIVLLNVIDNSNQFECDEALTIAEELGGEVQVSCELMDAVCIYGKLYPELYSDALR